MGSKRISLNHLQAKTVELEKTSSKMNLGEVFSERKGCYLNEFSLFLAHFNTIPNFIHEINIDCKKANKWFIDNFKCEIKDLYFDTNLSVVRLLFRKTDISKVETVLAGLKKFKERKARRKPKISLLVNTHSGIETKSLQISF